MSRALPGGVAALFRDFRTYAAKRLWLVLGLSLLGALAEGFGLLMIVPLATIAIGGGATAARYAPWIADVPATDRLTVALVLFLAAMAVRSLLLYAREVRLADLQNGYEASLRLRAAATLADRGWPFATRLGQAGLQSLLLNDVPRAVHAVVLLQSIAVAVLMLAVQFAIASYLSVGLALCALLFLLGSAAVATVWTRRGARSGRAIVDQMEQTTGSGLKLHAGLKAALAQGTVQPFLDEYRATLAASAARAQEFARDYTLAQQWASFAAAAAAALLLFVGVRLLELPFPMLIAALVLFARMNGPGRQLQQSVQQLSAYLPAFAAIERRLGRLGWPGAGKAPAPALDWARLEVAGAAYEHRPGVGLDATSLQMMRGQWVGLAGPSGVGKTTMVDLVAGLIEPQSGAILVDGKPLAGLDRERWRSALAYVGQEPLLFNDTVRGNLLADGATANEADLWEALETVGLAERIARLPDRLDAALGEGGRALSGGERQRLVLARALLRRPSLLILDEATASLDPAAEEALLVAIRALEPRPAALVVAHRASTLAHCETVVAIQHSQQPS